MLDENSLNALKKIQDERVEANNLSDDAKFQVELTSAMIHAITSATEAIIKYSESKPRKVAIEKPVTSVSTPDVMNVVAPLKEAINAVQSTLRGNRPDADQTNRILGDIHDVLAELPTDYPKPLPFPKKMDVKVTNPTAEPKELKNITKAIKAQKVEFKPKIDVAPTPVTVKEDSKAVVSELKKLMPLLKKLDKKTPEATDMSPLMKAIKETTKAIQAIRIPIPPATFRTVKVTNPDGTWLAGAGSASAEYASKISIVGNYTYVAEADPGTTEATALWRVRRVYQLGDETTVTWADGDNSFDNVATDLTTLTYS